jgi:hypothetical protein
MKSYIQDLCGDEDSAVIDVAILECCLKDAIFEKLVSWDGKPVTEKDIADMTRDILPKPLCYGTIQINMKRGDDDEGKTICWNAE